MAERHQALAGRNNMEEQNVELNENSSAQSEDSSVGSADGLVSTIDKIMEEKGAETLSCSISTNSSEIEEKETAKYDRLDLTIVQIIRGKETAAVSSSLAMHSPKMDEKESPVASCSYAINALEIGATGSSNSVPVPVHDDSDVEDPNEVSPEEFEKVKEDAEAAMEEMRWLIDSFSESVILRWRDAEKFVQETLKRAESRIWEANDDDYLRFQSRRVAQIFHNARSSARSKFHLFEAQILVAEGAYRKLRRKKKELEEHAIRNGMDEKLNALKGALSYKNIEARKTLESIASALEKMKKCYADIDEYEFLHERLEGSDPRIAYQSFCRRERRRRVVISFAAIATFLSAGVWTTHEAILRKPDNIGYILGAITSFFLSTACTVGLVVAPMREQTKAKKKSRKAIEEIDKELAKIYSSLQTNAEEQ